MSQTSQYFSRIDNDDVGEALDDICNLLNNCGLESCSPTTPPYVGEAITDAEYNDERVSPDDYYVVDSTMENDFESEDDGVSISSSGESGESLTIDDSGTTSDGLMHTTGPRGNGKTNAAAATMDITPSPADPSSNEGPKRRTKLKVCAKRYRNVYRFNPLPTVKLVDRQRVDGGVLNKSGDDHNDDDDDNNNEKRVPGSTNGSEDSSR